MERQAIGHSYGSDKLLPPILWIARRYDDLMTDVSPAVKFRLNGITRSPVDLSVLTTPDVVHQAILSMLNYYSRKEIDAVSFRHCCAIVLTFSRNICRNEARIAAHRRAVFSKIKGTLESRGYRSMQQ